MTKEQILDAIKELSVLELNDLVKAIEEEFGVTAAAPVAVVGGAAAGAAEADQGITRCPPSQGEAGTSAFWGWNNSFQKNGRLLLCRKNAG